MLLEDMNKSHWLFKSEPETFSIQDLKKAERQTTCWDGVRNYQARNFLRDSVKIDDRVFFYHSNANPPGIAGIAKVVKAGYPDPSQFQKNSHYYDPKATPEKPIWYSVDIALEKIFESVIPLDELKGQVRLKEMVLLQRSRLSIQPVREEEWKAILTLVH